MSIAIICTALLGVLLFGLAINVSLLRLRHGQLIGHDSSPTDPIHRAVPAHANTAEYAPFLAVLFLWFATRPAHTWIVAAIIVATAARFLAAAGLLWGKSLDLSNSVRFLGALFTYIAGLVLVVGLIRP